MAVTENEDFGAIAHSLMSLKKVGMAQTFIGFLATLTFLPYIILLVMCCDVKGNNSKERFEVYIFKQITLLCNDLYLAFSKVTLAVYVFLHVGFNMHCYICKVINSHIYSNNFVCLPGESSGSIL